MSVYVRACLVLPGVRAQSPRFFAVMTELSDMPHHGLSGHEIWASAEAALLRAPSGTNEFALVITLAGVQCTPRNQFLHRVCIVCVCVCVCVFALQFTLQDLKIALVNTPSVPHCLYCTALSGNSGLDKQPLGKHNSAL